MQVETMPRARKPAAVAPLEPPAGLRRGLSRHQILEAAVALADAGGIDNLSMRGVGRRLGVDTMSLYNHVNGKSALFDGMAEVLIAEAGFPGHLRWDRWAEEAARRILALAKAHPGAVRVFLVHGGRTVEAAAPFEPFVAALAAAGFPLEVRALMLNAFLGSAVVLAASIVEPIPPGTQPDTADTPLHREEAMAVIPHLGAAFDAHPVWDQAEVFEMAVGLLIEGMRSWLRRSRRTAKVRPTG